MRHVGVPIQWKAGATVQVSGVVCVWGYRVYKEVWKPGIGEELEFKREPLNISDRYAVCVVNCN